MSVRALTPYLAAAIATNVAFCQRGSPDSVASALPGDPRIEHVATLSTPRAAHTASALPSGQVLVVGGMGPGGNSLASAELIDPSDNSVAQEAPMSEARSGHSATVLSDGRVVIAGGYNGAYLSSVEIYDPARRRFEAFGRLVEGRSGHTATLLADGRVLLLGGVGDGWTFLASAEVFDPATGASQMVGSLSVPRESHTATVLLDGRILVVGGHQGRREAMEVYDSAEVYDPSTGRFSPAGRLGTARHKHDAVRLADGRVIVLGGADRTDERYYTTTEIYDPASQTFESGPSMSHSRYKIQGTAIRLPNDDILIPAGGRTAELLDRSITFREVAGDFPAAFAFATATLLPDGDVLIVGGYSQENENTGGVWRFHGASP